MRFKFHCTLVVQLSGEAHGGADQLDVFSEDKVRIAPTFMTVDSDGEVEALPEDEQKFIFQVITNNVLSRAHQVTRIAGVTVGVPVPAVIDTPTGERS